MRSEKSAPKVTHDPDQLGNFDLLHSIDFANLVNPWTVYVDAAKLTVMQRIATQQGLRLRVYGFGVDVRDAAGGIDVVGPNKTKVDVIGNLAERKLFWKKMEEEIKS
ncbi:hypothetical protein KBD71_04915 [Candidatus Woesebacteria bacterium]|nr:hypothetical protein [Candidatus Woesebacteria bacterium]